MRLTLFAFGKLKTTGLRETADYYKKILGNWISLDEFELKSISVPDKSLATRKIIQEKEAILLNQKLARFGNKKRLFLLEERGKALTTMQWAEKFQSLKRDGSGELIFCIGSSLGFSDEVRKIAQGSFSLGPQTLSHELARVVLLEQLYRAMSVLNGHPYHNEGT